MFRQVTKTGDTERIDAHKALLREAVSLNQNRILCRLRSNHAVLRCNFKKEKKARPKWVLKLCGTVECLNDPAIHTQEIKAIKADAIRLKLLYESLEALPRKQARSNAGLCVLVNLSSTCEGLYSRLTHKSILGRISTSNVQAIKRVSRYTTICKRLVRYSGRLPVFEKLQFEVVRIITTTYPKVKLEPFVADVVRKLASTPSRRYPVHAEMQLL